MADCAESDSGNAWSGSSLVLEMEMLLAIRANLHVWRVGAQG